MLSTPISTQFLTNPSQKSSFVTKSKYNGLQKPLAKYLSPFRLQYSKRMPFILIYIVTFLMFFVTMIKFLLRFLTKNGCLLTTHGPSLTTFIRSSFFLNLNTNMRCPLEVISIRPRLAYIRSTYFLINWKGTLFPKKKPHHKSFTSLLFDP